MVWVVGLLAALGCGSADGGAARSTPIPATKELGDPSGLGVKWSDLDGLVTGPAPSIPPALGGLAIGMPNDQARAILAGLHDPAMPPAVEVELEGHRAITAALKVFDAIGVTALVDLQTGLVDMIDVSVPSDQALYTFTAAWGPPTMKTHPIRGPVATWHDPQTGLTVELYSGTNGEDRGIAKFHQGAGELGPVSSAQDAEVDELP